MSNGSASVRIEVQPGATIGDYLNQLLAYLAEAGPRFENIVVETWIRRASDGVMPADLAVKLAEFALIAYHHDDE